MSPCASTRGGGRSPASVDDEADAQVHPPLGDGAVRAALDLGLVDPGALDVLDGLGALAQARLDCVFDAFAGRRIELDDLGDGHGGAPASGGGRDSAPRAGTEA